MKKKILNIPCVILSGGQSKRMGCDKALMTFTNNQTTIEYIHQKLSTIFQDVYISSKNDKFHNLQLQNKKLILDTQDIHSPMIALQSIFNTIKSDKVFIISVDIPLISKDAIVKLIEISNKNQCDITIAKDTDGNIHSLCGVFNRSILPLIEKLLDEDIHKINYMIKKTANFEEVLIQNSQQFLNLNTQTTYKEAQNIVNTL